MAQGKDEAIRLAKELITEANKVFYVKKAYLFGSFAKGNQHQWSDIDVALVSPDFKYIPEDMAMKMLFRLAATISSNIEPIPLTEEEIDRPLLGTLSYSIVREGLQLK